MSRIGKKPILIPSNVKIEFSEGTAKIAGPKGEILQKIHPLISVEVKDGSVYVSPIKKTENISAVWGTTRAIMASNIKGVAEGYEKKLEIEGVGYKAQLEGEDLVLNVGFSHPVKFSAIPGVKLSVDKNVIIVSGVNKELVNETAARIKRIKKPDPYKAKGIKYFGEIIKKKAGKKVVTAAK